MKVLILSLLSFNLLAGTFNCETKIEKHLILIASGVHVNPNQVEKKLNLSLEAVKDVLKCIKDKCSLDEISKEKIVKLMTDGTESVNREYDRFYRLQASNLDEMQRDAYMNDARSYVISKSKSLLAELKKLHDTEKEKLKSINSKRNKGKAVRERSQKPTESSDSHVVPR
jgi:hypothetical protein